MKKIRSWSSFVHSCVHEFRKELKRTKENHVEMCSKYNVHYKLCVSDVTTDTTVSDCHHMTV